MHLINRFYVKADKYQFVLIERVPTRKTDRVHGYYGSMEYLLRDLIRICNKRKIAESKIKEIKSWLNELKEIKETINKDIEKIVKELMVDVGA